ncbi:MAG: hypothetical protein ABR529_10325 [Actinomycetota bacterium]
MTWNDLQILGNVLQFAGVCVLIGGMVKSRKDLGLPPTKIGRRVSRARQAVSRALGRQRGVSINVEATDEVNMASDADAVLSVAPSWDQLDTEGKLVRLQGHIKELERGDERLHKSVQQEARERKKGDQDEAVAREQEDKAMAERFQAVTWSGLRPQIMAATLILGGLALNIVASSNA